MHRLDTPGVFLNDSGGWRMTLGTFNFGSKVSSGVAPMMNFGVIPGFSPKRGPSINVQH